MKRIVMVECKFVIPVEMDLEDAYDYWGHIQFRIEDNGCPGTGAVGAALEEIMERHNEAMTCWACTYNGENKIVSISPPMPPSRMESP